MKKRIHFKSLILGIIIGLVLAGTGVYAAIMYQSSEVGYDNSNSGLESTNVQDALEEVYDLAQNGGVTGVKGNAEAQTGSMFRDVINKSLLPSQMPSDITSTYRVAPENPMFFDNRGNVEYVSQ